MKRSLSRIGSGLLPLAVTACAADVHTPAPSADPSALAPLDGALISDQLHAGGTEGFLFLSPMVPRPSQFGDVVPGLPVRVEVDEVDANGNPKRHITTFAVDAEKPGDRVRYKAKDAPLGAEDDGDTDPMGYYVARWKTNDFALSNEATYRVSVVVPGPGRGRTLGFADVDVVKNQKQFKNVDTDEYTPLVNGDVLRIKFRVDRPAVDADADGTLDWDELTADANYHCEGEKNVIELGVTKSYTDDAPDAFVHTGALEVICGDVRFALDPALGAGTHTSEAKVGDKTYKLSYATSAGVGTVNFGTYPRIRRTWTSLTVERTQLAAQGLGSCVFGGTAAISDAPTLQGGPSDSASGFQPIVFENVPLTCEPQTLDGANSLIYTDYEAPVRMCAVQVGSATERHTFVDEHTTVESALVETKVAHFGLLGQPAAGRCPNAAPVFNDLEAVSLPLTKGQAKVTLGVASFRGTEAHKAALYAMPVTVSTTRKDAEGKDVVALAETTTLGDISMGRTVILPKDVYEAEGARIVLIGSFDRAKKPPQPPPPPPPPPSCCDHIDLELDVDVK